MSGLPPLPSNSVLETGLKKVFDEFKVLLNFFSSPYILAFLVFMRCFWNRLSRLVEGITSRERRADYRVGFVIIERLETRGDKRSFLVDLQDYFSGVNI